MKKIITLIISLAAINLFAQDKKIELADCINAAMNNKAIIKAKNTALVISQLEKAAAKGKYFPDISLAYENRYNPIIQSQILPIGQFKPIPDEEKRAVQFGTRWQQNAGITFYQPIIDYSIQSKIAASKINERLKNLDVQIASNELKFEVLKTFAEIFIKQSDVNSYAVDSFRTYSSYMLVKNNFDEGRILQTEMNRALLNHNNALLNYQSSAAALTNEIIYLSFLTGMALPELLEGDYVFSIFEKTEQFINPFEIFIDSFPQYRQFSVRDGLIKQQILAEKKKNLPTIGFQGFIGANQFTNGFNPFLNNSWFGNAYFGLTVKMPLLQCRNTDIVVGQFTNELKINDLNREDFKEKNTRDILQTKENIKSGFEKIKLVSVNKNLLKENITILMERLASGKQTASELNLAEIDLQKENTTLLQLKATLIKKQLELIYSMGILNSFLGK